MDHLRLNQLRLVPRGQRTLVVVAAAALVVFVFLMGHRFVQSGTVSALEALSSGLRNNASSCSLAFLIIGRGMGFGSIRMAGLSFGTSGVLFAGLLFGHLGRNTKAGRCPSASIIGTGVVGFMPFGPGAGPTFFRAFRTQGCQLAFLGIATVVVGAAT